MGGTECNWWAVGYMMWQKIASETLNEGDNMMEEVVNNWQGAGDAMNDEPGHVLVSGADVHGEGRHQARRMKTRSSAKRKIATVLAGRAYYCMRRGT